MIPGVLAWGRRNAEARMTETVQFFREVGETEDPVTHQPVPVEELIGDPVEARVKMTGTQPNDVDIAGQSPAVDRPEVHVPVGSVDVGEGVLVRVLSSLVDEALVGDVYRTRFAPSKGQVTAWRYPVEQVL